MSTAPSITEIKASIRSALDGDDIRAFETEAAFLDYWDVSSKYEARDTADADAGKEADPELLKQAYRELVAEARDRTPTITGIQASALVVIDMVLAASVFSDIRARLVAFDDGHYSDMEAAVRQASALRADAIEFIRRHGEATEAALILAIRQAERAVRVPSAAEITARHPTSVTVDRRTIADVIRTLEQDGHEHGAAAALRSLIER